MGTTAQTTENKRNLQYKYHRVKDIDEIESVINTPIVQFALNIALLRGKKLPPLKLPKGFCTFFATMCYLISFYLITRGLKVPAEKIYATFGMIGNVDLRRYYETIRDAKQNIWFGIVEKCIKRKTYRDQNQYGNDTDTDKNETKLNHTH